MAEITISDIRTFSTVECSECGVTLAMTRQFVSELRDSHRTFFCPNGHNQYFPGKSDLDKAREDANRLRQQLDQSKAHQQTLEQQVIEAGRDKDKLTKRVSAGVCPCCHRTVKQLAAHIKNKHPEMVHTPAGAVGKGAGGVRSAKRTAKK